MPASRAPESAAHRASRGRHALPLSVALHAVAFYGLVHVPWGSAPVPPPVRSASVIWLVDPSATQPPEPPPPDLLPEDAAAPNTPQALEPTEPPPAVARSSVPRRAPPAREPPPSAVPPQPEVKGPEAAAQRAAPPNVDWEKERQAAARSVVQQQGRPGTSLDGSSEKPRPAEPVEPATTALVNDGCVIAKNRAQRFTARLMGRCVRGPRGDMFAAIMPEYLKVRPVCIETHPEAPGSVLSDGTEISTVKCELVRKGAPEPLPADIPGGDASLARAGAQ